VVTQLVYKILYWKGIYKKLQGGKISWTVLWKQARQGVESFQVGHLQMPQAAVCEKIKSAIQDYKQIKKQSDRHNIWVTQMITAQAEAQNIPKTKLWKRLQQTEQSRSTTQKVKQVLGTITAHAGLSQVTTPMSQMDNTRITITTKEELETACLEDDSSLRWHKLQCYNHPWLNCWA